MKKKSQNDLICACFVFRVKEQLLAEHKAAWKALWDTGRIEIEGDLEMAQAVYGSMYYILSSTRHDWPYGLSPGGLPGGEEYMGHTFWDQDIWMYPPLVLLHPDLARSSLKYRKDRLPAARRIAKEYGYKGNRTGVSRHYPLNHRIKIESKKLIKDSGSCPN